MGIAAEMKLDGTLCECCGVVIREGEAQGFPRRCSDCGKKNIEIKRFIKEQADIQSRIEFTQEELREIYYFPFIENYFTMLGGLRNGAPPTFAEWLEHSGFKELDNGHYIKEHFTN